MTEAKRHTITVDELRKWADTEVWHLAASSFGEKSEKKLEMNNRRFFRVTDHGEVIYAGDTMEPAVDAYNAAP